GSGPSSRLRPRDEVRAVHLLATLLLEAKDLDVPVVLAGDVEAPPLGADLSREVVVRAQVRKPRLPDPGLPAEDVREGAREGMRDRADEVVDLLRRAGPGDSPVVRARAAECGGLRFVLRAARRGSLFEILEPALEDLDGGGGDPRLDLAGCVVGPDRDPLLIHDVARVRLRRHGV